MPEIIHTSRIKINRDRGPIRIAQIEGFSEPVFYGVHGGIQKFYKVDPVEEHAATLDHIVGAVSAWMMGTFASVLATKKIRTHTDRFQANVEGDIENIEGVLKITVIRVHYALKLAPKEEDDARWAMENYIEKCPAAMSVTGCIRIEHSLELVAEWSKDTQLLSNCKSPQSMDRGLFLFIATSSKLANLQEAIIVNPLASYSRIA